jgi:mono/diheme cytochrome c family protein
MALAVALAIVATAEVADAVPAFARQYDLQCSVCHTRPPRLNRFGEQFT